MLANDAGRLGLDVPVIRVYLMLGGLVGPDGNAPLVNDGMHDLARQLAALPGVKVAIYTWDQVSKVLGDIRTHETDKTVVIGYSGGGTRATMLANAGVPRPSIDLMVLYDPSPKNQMHPIGGNVKRAICYFNRWPLMFGLGGGLLVAAHGGPRVEVVPIGIQHMFVQSSQALHDRTIAAVKALA